MCFSVLRCESRGLFQPNVPNLLSAELDSHPRQWVRCPGIDAVRHRRIDLCKNDTCLVLCFLVLWLRDTCFLAFSGTSKTKLSAWKTDVLNATVLGNEVKGVVAAGLSSPGSFSEPLVGEVGGERGVGNP